MNEAIMAEEMKPQNKVAFAQRKYTNEEKRKKEEEELEQLMKEQSGEVEEKKKNLHPLRKRLSRNATETCADMCKKKKQSSRSN